MYFILFKILYVYMCLCICWCHQEPEKGIGSPEAVVLGTCELPDMGARIWATILYKSNKCAYPSSHIAIPVYLIINREMNFSWLST